jgi:hypothetical protein
MKILSADLSSQPLPTIALKPSHGGGILFGRGSIRSLKSREQWIV